VSPGITSDGALRFGKIVIDDAVEPQTSTFAQIFSCTQPYGVVDNDTCVPPGAGAAPGQEIAQPFPARLKFKHLTADVLVGNTT